MPRKPDYTNHQKQIQGKRLQSVLIEKNRKAADVVRYIKDIEGTDYTDKFPKYKRGELAIPRHIIPLVAEFLEIDPGFFTDVASFSDSFFSDDYSYAGYLKYKNFENITSDDFYKKYSAILSIFNYKLGVYDNGLYGLYENSPAFNPVILQLSKEELIDMIERIKKYAFEYIRAYSKEGDAIE